MGVKKFLNKLLYLPVLIMGLYLLIRLIDQSNMIKLFPLINNDITSYIAQLYFLKVCGFHQFCPYWYNGFITFLIPSPGWQFFTLPIYIVLKNILLSTYVSFILMYILGFVFIYYLGKSQKFSLVEILFLFIITFGNSMSIGNFTVLSRATAMMGWILLLGIAALAFYYKKHAINLRFVFFFTLLNSWVIITHYQEAVLAQTLVLSLFIIKKGYERLIIALSFLLSLILSSFWWIPFLSSALSTKTSNVTQYQGKWFIYSLPELKLTTQSLTSLLIITLPIILIILFYFYWQQRNKPLKEFLFYSPILILCVLFWLRLTAFLPVLNQISPDPFLLLFTFFSVLILLKTRFSFYPKFIKSAIILSLILLPLANVIISHTKTHYWSVFEYDKLDEETISLLNFIGPSEKFVITNWTILAKWNNRGGEAAYYYAYAPVYHNLSTADGYYYLIPPEDYFSKLKDLSSTSDCNHLKSRLYELNINAVITYEKRCDFLKNCGLKEVISKKYSCLYKL